MEYRPDMHDRDDEYHITPEAMNIDVEITGDKQHQLGAMYFAAACTLSRKLVCSFSPKRKYLVHGHLNRCF